MKEQEENDNLSKYAARLAEERRRVHPHQGEFARSIGSSQGKQSLFERGERALRAGYLEQVAEAGLDIGFIITGQRSGDSLDPAESELVGCFRDTDADNRETILRVARALAGRRAMTQSLHAPRTGFAAENQETM